MEEEILDNVLLLQDGNYYKIPSELMPFLISILEANGLKMKYLPDDYEITVKGTDRDN